MMKSLSCVLLLFVCNVIHSNNCCLKNEESDVVNFVKRKLLGGCKEVKNSIDSSIKNANDIIKDDLKVMVQSLMIKNLRSQKMRRN